REWSDRLESYAELGQLAAAVRAPGHDMFDTRDEEAESANLDRAMAAFEEKMRELREEADSRRPVMETATLLAQMDAAQEALNQTTDEAKRILSCFRDNQSDEAGKHRAAMDRKFAQFNAALLRLQSSARKVQESRLADHLAEAASLRRTETALGL